MQLRAATDEIHQALHGAAPFARIAAGTIGRKEYGAVLAMLHRYHGSLASVCEAAALAMDVPVLAQAQAARLAALKDDLDFLHVPTARGTGQDVATDDGFAIGCLYTAQGSTLGGKVIARQLDALLDGPDGRRFFSGSAQDSAHWRILCDGLEDWGTRHGITRLEAGSRHAFRRFAQMLTPAA